MAERSNRKQRATKDQAGAPTPQRSRHARAQAGQATARATAQANPHAHASAGQAGARTSANQRTRAAAQQSTNQRTRAAAQQPAGQRTRAAAQSSERASRAGESRSSKKAKQRPSVEAKSGKSSRTRGRVADASRRKVRGAKKNDAVQGQTQSKAAGAAKGNTGGYQAIAGGRMKGSQAKAGVAREVQPGVQGAAQSAADEQVSKSIGEIKREERSARMRESSKRHVFRLMIVLGVVVALIAGWGALYNSPAFTITSVSVEGVEHLTTDEMTQLANVPTDTTLLRVDTETIRNRIMQNAWVQDVRINRLFPETLQIVVTERQVTAVVEMPSRSGSSVKSWAIAEDHMWLMPIPDANSEAAKTTSAKVYEDAERALHITDVPYGTQAEIGTVCTDGNVNNALDILAGMTTDLKDHIVQVSAGSTAETTLMLDTGVEIAFGKAENIRDKERVIMKILEENPDGVAYINVRIVETPTWRAI